MLPLLVAAAFRLADQRSAGRGASGRRDRSGGCPPPHFLFANPHALLSWDEFWSDVSKQEEAASGFGKLGARPGLGRPLLPRGC